MARHTIFAFQKRTFLSPASTETTSYIHAVVESSDNGGNRWGTNMLTLADCHRRIQLEFFLGSNRQRRLALAKINLLIDVLTAFRDALANEIASIEKTK